GGNNSRLRTEQPQQYVLGADEIVMETKGFLSAKFQNFPRAGCERGGSRKRSADESQEGGFQPLQACPRCCAGFRELVQERRGLAETLNSDLERLLRAHSRRHPLFH